MTGAPAHRTRSQTPAAGTQHLRPPRIAVVISTYNRAQLVDEAIRSVEAQGGADVEIIVVDDGSTDDTARVVRERHPAAVYVLQPHSGHPGAARNRGLAAACSELVAFLDDDDVFLPGKLAAQLAAFDAHPSAGLAYSDGHFFADDPSIPIGRLLDGMPRPSGDAFPDLLRGNFIFPSMAVVRRACLDAAGVFDEDMCYAQDYDLWLRLAARYPVIRVDGELVGIRRHAMSMSRGRVSEMRTDAVRILHKMEHLHPELVRRHAAAFHEGFARNCAAIAVAQLRERHLATAAQHASRAFLHAARSEFGGLRAFGAWWKRRAVRRAAQP
jgi:glycosyltransferase involved in cell wall biosynthesis